jgi:hypothetical protein
MTKKLFSIAFLFVCLVEFSFGQEQPKAAKNPLIIIPGLGGSVLTNKRTNETVWVTLSFGKADQLMLPISPNLATNRDDIVATDILSQVKIVGFLPGFSIYDGLLKFLNKKVGYRELDWDGPTPKDFQNTYYVFPYDWRLDVVENSRLLIQKIEKLKAKSKNPDLKFDVVAHSLGGLLIRYAAMYGDEDLPAHPLPNWSGTKHFERIFLLATPNEGSMSALSVLKDGVVIGAPGIKISPEFLGREIAFSMPSMFELLPHGKAARFFDENLKPLSLDIYSAEVWKKYGWSLTSDKRFTLKNGKYSIADWETYLDAVLARTKKFHEALDVKTAVPSSITFFAYGADCKKTLETAIVYFDTNDKIWKTIMDGDSFRNSKGEEINSDKTKKLIYADGDGTVTRRSLFGETLSDLNGQSLFLTNSPSPRSKMVCERHTTMTGNKTIQETFASAQGLHLIK